MLKLDIGTFYPSKGKSNSEIAAESRSMHKCQGMGMLSSRGNDPQYLDFLKGSLGKPTNGDPLQGIDLTWNRLGTEGGEIGKILADVEKNFRYENPAASVPALVSALKFIEKISDPFWKNKKMAEISDLIRSCSGLYLEATTTIASSVPGEAVEFSVEAVNRSATNVKLTSVQFVGLKSDTTLNFDS